MRISVSALIIAFLVFASAVAGVADQRTDDEAAIRKSVVSYVEAFNKGDFAAVAAHWSDDGEYVSSEGESFKGRKKIEAAFKTFFAENQGMKLQATPTSILFKSPNRAVETGIAIVTRPGENPEEIRYTATHVKKAGVWKIATVKDEDSSGVLPSFDHLKDLEWLIGEWVDADEDSKVETTFRWARNKSFITSSYTVSAQGKIDLQGTLVIGWDPVRKTVRSWNFDSAGGFGEGTWSRRGNQWVVNATHVLGTGEKASSINTYTYVDDNTFTWQSIGREVGGVLMPNVDPVTVVRKPASEPPSKPKK